MGGDWGVEVVVGFDFEVAWEARERERGVCWAVVVVSSGRGRRIAGGDGLGPMFLIRIMWRTSSCGVEACGPA